MFSIIPWTLFLILYMAVVHLTSLPMDGILGYLFLALCVIVLFLEFYKSGDINVGVFLIDLISSVIAVVVATALMSYLVFKHSPPTFFDWFGFAVILGDAILSPFNSFRTALRDVVGLGLRN